MPKKVFFCGWCNIFFETKASYVSGNVDPLDQRSKGKKQACSSQIKCPKCQNFVSTWRTYKDENGKKIRLETRMER